MRTIDVVVHELVVDAARTADLVVDGAGTTRELRLASLPFQDRRSVDRRGCSRRARHVVIELLGALKPHPVR